MISTDQKQAAIDLLLYQADLIRADIGVVVAPDPDPISDPVPDPVEPPVVVPDPPVDVETHPDFVGYDLPVLTQFTGPVGSLPTFRWTVKNFNPDWRFDGYIDDSDNGDSKDSSFREWVTQPAQLPNGELSPGDHVFELRVFTSASGWDEYRSVSMSFTVESRKIETPTIGKYAAQFAELKADVDSALATQEKWSNTFAQTPMSSNAGYHSWPAMAGLSQAFRATDEKKYLDAAIRIGRKWIESGRKIDSDQWLDWQGPYVGDKDINIEHHEWRAGAGLADILIEIKRSGYEGQSGTEKLFLDFLREQVWNKWRPGRNIQGAGYTRSNISTFGLSFAGRLGVIAMALDQYDPKKGDNEYSEYINSAAKPFGIFFPTLIDLKKNRGVAYLGVWTNDKGSYLGKTFYDTSHGGDMIYPVCRANQLGYDPQGKMQETLAVIEHMLDTSIFKTSKGFTEYSSGSGNTNNSEWASAHGYGMTARFSDSLMQRWLAYVKNKPYFYDQPERRIWMAAGIMAAMAES